MDSCDLVMNAVLLAERVPRYCLLASWYCVIGDRAKIMYKVGI